MAKKLQPVHTFPPADQWVDRPEFEQLCNWWRSEDGGICCICGIAGEGKTALVERFLRALPGLYAAPVRISPKLPKTHAFQFSFFESRDTSEFADELCQFLSVELGVELKDRPSHSQKRRPRDSKAIRLLQRFGNDNRGRLLIALDGLELFQSLSNKRGPVGQVLDKRLDEIILRISRGTLPNVYVVATSCFPLVTQDHDPPGLTSIPLNGLSAKGAVTLLERCGVADASNVELQELANACEYHPLFIQFVGSYAKKFSSGKLTEPLHPADLLLLESDGTTDADRVNSLASKLARLTQRYARALELEDPLAKEVLERVCLFHSGVDAATFCEVFLSAGSDSACSVQLENCTEADVFRCINELEQLFLVRSRRTENDYIAHTVIREGFLGFLASYDSPDCDHDIRDVLLNALTVRPNQSVCSSNPSILDLFEHVIQRMMEQGQRKDALSVYMHRLGGFPHLGKRLSQFDRGRRICEALTANLPDFSSRIAIDQDVAYQSAQVVRQKGRYLSALGRTSEAVECYDLFEQLRDTFKKTYGRTIYANHAMGLILAMRGELRKALDTAKRRHSALPEDRHLELRDACANLADLNFQSGEIPLALKYIADCEHYERTVMGDEWPGFLTEIRGVLQADLLLRLGAFDAAYELAAQNRERLTLQFGPENHHHATTSIQMAEAALSKNVEEAVELLNQATDFVKRNHHAFPLCRIHLLCARLIFQKGTDTILEDVASGELSEMISLPGLDAGIALSRKCGYGLYHIDLLLERARLHLLRGDADAAFDDIEVALDVGVSANEGADQVQLLAANHKECGYAWAIPAGLQLRAEAHLLQAAQALGVSKLNSIHDELDAGPTKEELPAEVGQEIDYAKQLLKEALGRWHALGAPNSVESNNFVDPRSGKEYNYKAEASYQVLFDLEDGVLTRKPIEQFVAEADQPVVEEDQVVAALSSPRVFISYAHDSNVHAVRVLELANRLRGDGIEATIDQYIQNPSNGWAMWMSQEIEAADFVLVVSTELYAQKAQEPQCSGAYFESFLILQELYSDGMSNDKVIPIVFDSADAQHIPNWIKLVKYYNVSSSEEYDSLLRRLLDDPATVAPAVAVPVKKGPASP